ncbi:MAG: sigma-70 family RNA polymerase sigma factor [Porphyromonadaceae bacterium]|nr:sigma-70 family RNA polymerase sigma factor [Porphyromonadaceae bacterium]
MDEKERREIVAEVMKKIPAGDALLLTLYYLEDNPVKEIAKITGLNEPNVKVKLFRARKLFKEMVVSNYGIQITGS